MVGHPHVHSTGSLHLLIDTVGTDRLVFGTNFAGWDADGATEVDPRRIAHNDDGECRPPAQAVNGRQQRVRRAGNEQSSGPCLFNRQGPLDTSIDQMM